ncbi:MAG: hypothetical protein R6T91_08475 [Bacteroidales bacterium]
MINNYSELKAVKSELKGRINETEIKFISQHQWISTFLSFTGVYDNKKNPEKQKQLHSLIVQAVSDYLQENGLLKKFKDEYTTVVIPLILTALSAFVVKKL